MTLMARGQAFLNRKQQLAGGVQTVYSRGPWMLILAPWVGQTKFASTLDGKARLEWGDRDYLIPAAELILDGVVREPAVGDRITEIVGGVSMVFECKLPGTGEPAWRYSDPSRTLLRIHMKRVA